jgi:post-segregation antitoxin (ccd killing protein)
VSKVISVSIPEALYERWREADIDISPSSIFQSALETELDQSNRFLVYWSSRALNAEKKLSVISKLLKANDQEIKKLLLFESDR